MNVYFSGFNTSTNTVYTGMHILGGTSVGTSNLYNCLAACAAVSTTCLGVDYDSSSLLCFFHSSTTECTTLVSKSVCTHVRLTDTCSK